MAKQKGDIRRQASLGTELKRNINNNNSTSDLVLARVSKVDYENNSIEYIVQTNGMNNSSGAISNGGARLPVSFGGKNGYGNPYGSVNTIRVNDIVLIGFVGGKKNSPIVISKYLSDEDAYMLSDYSGDQYMAPNDEDMYDKTNSYRDLYPDLTYSYHNGNGYYEHTFSGNSFLVMDDYDIKGNFVDYPVGEVDASTYYSLRGNKYKDGTNFDTLNYLAPNIFFKHQGSYLLDDNGEEKLDHHQTNVSISPQGTTRLTTFHDDDKWLSLFSIDGDNGEISLTRENDNSINIGDTSDSNATFTIDKDNNLILSSGNTKMTLSDGHHIIASDLDTDSDKIDLYQSALNNKNSISGINNSINSINNNMSSSSSSLSTVNDQVNMSASSISQTNAIASSIYGNATTSVNMFSLASSIANTEIDSNTGFYKENNGSLSTPKMAAIRNFTYILTAYSVTSPVTIKIAFYDLNKNFINEKEVTGTSGDISVTAISPDNAVYISASVSSNAFKVKLEQADKVTSWSPSIVDLYTNNNTVLELLSAAKIAQADTNAKMSTVTSNNYLNSLLQYNNDSQILASDKDALANSWDLFKADYKVVVSYATKYSVDLTTANSYYTPLENSIEKDILVDRTSNSPAGDYTINIKGLQSALDKVIPNIISSALNSVITAQNTLATNTSSYRNLLLGTTTNISATGDQKLYSLSNGASQISGSTILSFTFNTTDVNSNFSINEVILNNDGSINKEVVLIDNLPNNMTNNVVSSFIQPIVPTLNQKADIYIRFSSYRQPVQISNMIMATSNTTKVTWVAAPEDISNTTTDKLATFKITDDQITSAVFDHLLEQSDVFTQTAEKAQIAVTQGDVSAGLSIEAGKMVWFGKEIDILGDIVDNNKITGAQFVDTSWSSTTGNFSITNTGVTTGMSLNSSTITNTTFNLSASGEIIGNYVIADSTTSNIPIKSSGKSIEDNSGIKSSGSKQSYINGSWVGYDDSLNLSSSVSNKEISTISPSYLEYTILNTLGKTLMDTKVTSDGVYLSDTSNSIKYTSKGISANNSLAIESPAISSKGIYNNTSSASANLTIDDSGIIHRVSSSEKYKKNISPIDDIIDKGKALLTITPKKWQDKNNDKDTQVGLIAEDLEKVGLSEFLFYKDGKPEGIQYDRLFILLMPLIKNILEEQNG